MIREQFEKLSKAAESWVDSRIAKYGFPTMGRSRMGAQEEEKPIYERQYSPFWVKGIAERQSLVNNSIEEKVNQAFRRGFTDWQKEYAAKCLECEKEFQSLQPFKEQLGEDGDELEEEEIDLDHPRVCPECGELSEIKYPKPEHKKRGEEWFQRANMKEEAETLLPKGQTSVSQTFRGVCIEVAWDIQTFDDGWMLFERNYKLDQDGNVVGWDFNGAYRAPPYLMRYSVSEEGKIGGEYWLCLDCRAKDPESYHPQEKPGPCEECGNRTYEVFAYALSDFRGGDPEQFYIQGEFAHDSEYRPTRLYGLSPIISLADEAKTLQKMDEWYRSAYEERRAPRGAIVVKSSNAESVRAWNQNQMQRMNSDPQHIPVFMDDTGGGGNPISWQPLLDDPAQMQHMQMREWFLDRIAAKYGVTAVFNQGNASNSGMSQSLEIVVANRSTERLQKVFHDTFIPAFLGQLELEGWDRKLKPPEEEDEQAEEQLRGRKLSNARTAQQVGWDVEWTEDADLDVKPGLVEAEEEGDDGGLGGLFGQDPDPDNDPRIGDDDSNEGPPGVNEDDEDHMHSHPSDRPTEEEDDKEPAGTTTPTGGRPRDPNEMGGQPRDERTPTTDKPYRRSEGAVTSGTSGYRNAVYGESSENVLNVLEDVEDDDESEDQEKLERIKKAWEEADEEKDVDLPNFDKIAQYAFNRPDKSYRAFKRTQSGAWAEEMEEDELTRTVFEFLRARR